jgi:hypothetical protein
VIERTADNHLIRTSSDGEVLAAANHFVSSTQPAHASAHDPKFVEDSATRMGEIHQSLQNFECHSGASDFRSVLNPVENDLTCQRMAFIPATGDVAVWTVASKS